MNGYWITFGNEGKEKRVLVPESLVMMTVPFFLVLFPFLPIKARAILTFEDRRVIARPIWRVLYGHYRKWRMGRFRKRENAE
jgi:hypothetical protein